MKTVKNTAVKWNTVLGITLPAEMIYRGNLILVNEQHSFQALSQENQLAAPFPEQPEHLMMWEAAQAIQGLLRSLQAGRRIVGVSGYRTMKEQIAIWNDSEAENGLDFTRRFVAVPGHSEHQTGLAMDVALNQKKIDFICPEFPYEGICQEFRKLASDYGFIERYPAGKESVTGIGAEPWHFRYVGIPHARIMKEQGMVMEEYVEWLRGYDWNSCPLRYWDEGKEFRIGWIPCGLDDKEVSVILPEHCRYAVSGNNVDGLIMTACVL